MAEKEFNIKEEYEKLKKKCKSLPNYNNVEFEFEISSIEKDGFLCRRILERVVDRIEYLQKILEGILQPDTNSFSSMYECYCFNEEEKKHILEVYKKLMVLYREGLELIIEMDEKKQVEFICKVTKDWKEYRKKVTEKIKKLKGCWLETKEYKEILQYMG